MKKGYLILAVLVLSQQLIFAAGADTALEEGKKFLEENAKKEGVVTLESGLQYKILSVGDGAIPGANDIVQVYYHGYFINGKEFDGTDIIRPPVYFRVNEVIKGWTEALQLMPVGSIWEVYIPSDLAYGKEGSGSTVPPNSTLIFEMELVGIL